MNPFAPEEVAMAAYTEHQFAVVTDRPDESKQKAAPGRWTKLLQDLRA